MSKNSKPRGVEALEQMVGEDRRDIAAQQHNANELLERLQGQGNPSIDVGPNVFDALQGMSHVGQITGYRAIGNSAICCAVYNANNYLESDLEDEIAQQLMAQNVELYDFCVNEINTLATTKFDQPLSIEDAVAFVASNATARLNLDALPDDILDALDITKEQLALIDAKAKEAQARRNTKLRETMHDRKDALVAELKALAGSGSEHVVDQLTPQRHESLFQKVSIKLKAKQMQVIGLRDRYQGALSDAMLLTGDIKELDRAFVAFLRHNANAELKREGTNAMA